MTKKEIITLITNEIGKPFSLEIYNRVGDRIIALRAKYLRQSIGKYGIDELLKQSYTLELKKVNENGCIYFKSICKVPIPIRAIGMASPFNYVGNVNGIPYTYLRIYETQTIPHIPVNKLNKYYTFKNGYIEVYNSQITKLVVSAVFESIEDLINCGGDCFDEDMELPMPGDIVDIIVKDLIQEFGSAKPLELDVDVKE
jgi:hypothetical protein